MQAALDSIADGLIHIDRRGTILCANRAALEMLGHTEPELSGRHLADAVCGGQESVKNCLDTVCQSGSAVPRKSGTFKRKDGSFLPVEYSCSPVSGGETLVFSFADARQKLAAESTRAQLLQSQERYALAVDGAMDGIWDLDMQTNNVYFSVPFATALGYEPSELPGKLETFYALCHPEDVKTVETAVRRHIVTRTPFADVEFRMRRKNGTYSWFIGRGKAMWNESGRAVRFAGSNREINAQKHAEERLRDSEGKFRALAENVREIFWILDESKNSFVYVSPAFEEITGCSTERVYGDAAIFFDFLHQDDRELARQNISNDGAKIEYRLKRVDGNYAWMEAKSFRVTEPDGSAVRVYGVAHDMSSRKEAEKRVNEFYSTISHELRTPLTSIRGALGLLSGGGVEWNSPDAKEMVEVACESSERLIRLISDILDLKKIEAGMVDLHVRELDLRDLVNISMAGMQGMAKEAGIELKSELQSTPCIMGDRDKLIQVLTNLISNAIKFSPTNSTVLVRAHKTEGERVRISVTDNGPGIAAIDLHKLFGKFQQLDSTDARQKGGTGLGLAICKAITEQHRGTIGVDSTPKKGSTFWFEVPCKQD